jgi:hypothetical protein
MAMEWLRLTLLRPLVEFLLLFPSPLRYSVVLIAGVLLLAILPLGILLRPLAHALTGLLLLVAGLARAVLAVIAGCSSSLRLLDRVDDSAEWFIQRCSTLRLALRPMQRYPMRRLRLRRHYLLVAALLPVAIWATRPLLGDIAIGRSLDQGAYHLASLAGWIMNGKYAPLPAEVVGDPTLDVAAPEEITGASPDAAASEEITATLPDGRGGATGATAATPTFVTDLIHEVQPGESLRAIAGRYGLQTTCIRQANTATYPEQNWDMIQIGQQLLIPLSDPSCRA